MDWFTLIGIALGLAMDAFAVAIATSVSLGSVTSRQIFRLSWHFGLFQFMMPVIGWYAAMTVEVYIRSFDHWIAFLLLLFVGCKAIREALSDDGDERAAYDPTKGASLVILSVATSIDALAVGLSFAALGVHVWQPAVVIGVVACVMTVVGMMAGARLGARFGTRMEVVGGLVLIGIGIKILAEHLL